MRLLGQKSLFFICLGACVLTACTTDTTPPPEHITGNRRHRRFKTIGKVFDKKALTFYPNQSVKGAVSLSSTPPTYKASALFQAALGVVSAYPIALSDSSAGVIVTDWRTDTSTRRSKVIIRLIKNQPHVQVFQQTYQSGTWWDAPQATACAEALRTDILNKAHP
jgi:hypothetical protein